MPNPWAESLAASAALAAKRRAEIQELASLRNIRDELVVAVRHYHYCPHGSIDCFCTKEARAALYKVENL